MLGFRVLGIGFGFGFGIGNLKIFDRWRTTSAAGTVGRSRPLDAC